MTKQEAKKAGEKHAEAGKQCTPYDCREIDAVIFAATKNAKRPAKAYATLRDAFNRGWQETYFKIVSA
jgi:hypothetical protein